MSRANRLLIALLLASCLALAGLLFGPPILEGFLKPLSTGIWLLLRIFVLSVDQALLWAFLVLALLAFIAYRLFRVLAAAPPRPRENAAEPNSALGDLEYWRYLFSETPRDPREYGLVQRELARLLCSAYASRNGSPSDFELFSAFKEKRIPLPESLHSFLFGDEAKRKRPRLEAWWRRASGRERAEYRRSIAEYLDFMESQMELRDEER